MCGIIEVTERGRSCSWNNLFPVIVDTNSAPEAFQKMIHSNCSQGRRRVVRGKYVVLPHLKKTPNLDSITINNVTPRPNWKHLAVLSKPLWDHTLRNMNLGESIISRFLHRLLYNTDGKAADQRIKREASF